MRLVTHSKLSREASQLQKQLDNSVNGEQTEYESESEMEVSVKPELGLVSEFLLLLLFWIVLPFAITLGCLLLLMVGFVMWAILASLWVLERLFHAWEFALGY